HVARELVMHGALDVGPHLHLLTAADHAELRYAGDLVGEADAAGTVDAPCHVDGNEGAEVLVLHGALALAEPGDVAAEADREVLKLALPALVANRAVERMVDEQELHGRALCADRARRVREDLHAFGHRSGARRHGLRRLLHLDQAHAAVGGHSELVVIAEARNVRAVRVRDADDHLAFAGLDRLAVDLDVDELFSHVMPPALRAGP